MFNLSLEIWSSLTSTTMAIVFLWHNLLYHSSKTKEFHFLSSRLRIMHLYRKLQTTPSSGVPRIRNRYDVSTCAVHIEYKGSLFPTCFFLQGIVYLLWLLLHRYHQASLAAQRTGTFCSHPSCTKSLMILLEQRRTEINDYQSLIKIRSPIWLLHWKIAVLTLSKRERGGEKWYI